MAKVNLDKSIEQTEQFTDWVCRKIRKTDGESQAKVARYIGISQPALSSRITEKAQWSLREFFAIQDYFGEEFKCKKEENKDEND